jgi:hypothetical protein
MKKEIKKEIKEEGTKKSWKPWNMVSRDAGSK